MCRYLTSLLLIVCGFCSVNWASESSANASPQVTCVDSDADGLEDSLEVKLGTDPTRADTDGDGLSDYDEYCKYRTDPTKKDTDGDGIPDGDWQERREYAYTIRAVCEIRPPNDAALMNDLYQDVRPAGRKARLADGTVVEILLFPFSTPHVFAQPYPRTQIPDSLRQYVEPDFSMNFSDEMQKEIKEKIVAGAKTDVEAIEKILAWMAHETRLANDLPEFAYFNVVDNKIVWRQSLGSPEKDQELLQTNFFGDAMFKSRRHGTCTSTATLRATMLRAAGLPTRLIQNLPLITRYEGDPEPLVEALRMRVMSKGYDWGQAGGGANHCYNEVFLNNHWIRVDNVINPGPFVGSRLFVKVYSLASWNNRADWRTPRPPEEGWNENRSFRTLEVSDAYAKHPSGATTTIDMAVDDESLAVTANPDGSFTATITIRNKGSMPTPEFGVYFYAGDPEKNGRRLATHASGPIMPGGAWGEYDPHLRLTPEEDTIVVVIDPENRVKESDESNNKATCAISGRRASQPQGTRPGPQASETATGMDMAVDDESLAVKANPDGSFAATITIRNQGSMPTPQFGVYFYAGDPQKNGRLLRRHNSGPILPGGVWGEYDPHLLLRPDEDTIVVVIDPDDKVKESNESNNKATRAVPERKTAPSPAATGMDMAVDDESLAVTANPDGTFTATIAIRNKGSKPTPEFGVNFYAGDPRAGGRLLAEHSAGPILPGETWNESNPQLRLTQDEDTIVVVIDPDDKVKESNESNNKATRVVPGRRASQPQGTRPGPQASEAATGMDMAVDDQSLAVTANPDGSFVAKIIIRNRGSMPTPQFGVYFYAGDPQKKGRLLSRHAAGPILPGEVWCEFDPHLVLTPDEDTIVVAIDPDNSVKESDESNNKATRVIPGRKAASSRGTTSARQRPAVTLVVGPDRMTFEGQTVTWEQLPALLEKVPNRPQTIFAIATSSQEIEDRADWSATRGRLISLSSQYGFAYASLVGVHPLGTKSGPPQAPPSEGQAK